MLKAEAERGAGLGHSADAGRAGEWRSGRAKQAVGKLGRALASGGKAPSRPCAGERGGAWDWADSWCWADVGRRKKQAGQGKTWASGPKIRKRVFLLFLIPFLFLVFQSTFKCKPNANSNRV